MICKRPSECRDGPCGDYPRCNGGVAASSMALGSRDPKPAPSGQTFPEDAASRESMPLATGLLDYFPNALAYVATISHFGSLKHNPGEEMHWARDKSLDHANKIGRHLIQRGQIDSDGIRHSGNLVWRALALLQTELEDAGLCPPSRASRFPSPEKTDVSSR